MEVNYYQVEFHRSTVSEKTPIGVPAFAKSRHLPVGSLTFTYKSYKYFVHKMILVRVTNNLLYII